MPFLKACEQRFADICEGRRAVPPDMVVVRDISIIKRIRAGELPKSLEKSQNIVYKVGPRGAGDNNAGWIAKLTRLRPTPTSRNPQFNFIHTDDVLKNFIYDPRMTSMASAFCGYGLKTIDMMLINKPPEGSLN